MRRAVGSSSHRSVAREVDEELGFHIEMRTRELLARGVSPDEARRLALAQFGDVERVRQSCVTCDQERLSAMQRANVFDELRQDLSYAFRTIHRNRGFALTIALIIALGVGANTAIFSLVHAVMLRPLPVRTPQELVALGDPAAVGSAFGSSTPQGDMFTYQEYRQFRERTRAFSGVLASGRADRVEVRTEAGQEEADRPRARFVSANYFQVLGVPARVGRTFDGSEDSSIGGAPVVTISHAYWTRKLASDAKAVGRELLINGARFTIIGITPEWFTGEIVGQSIDIFLPVTMQPVVTPKRPWLNDPERYWLLLLGRRLPGVTIEQARSQVQTDVRAILGETGGFSAAELKDVIVPVSSGARGFSRLRDSYGSALVTLMIGVGLLLLIICANVANLLLARALARSREMSVRLAIGAGRGRLVRQLLTESLVLGLLGTLGGLLLSRWGSRALLVLAADGAPYIPLDTGLNAAVLSFTAGVSILAVVLFGLVPALRTSRVELGSALRASSRSMSGASGSSGGRYSAGRVLIAAQVGLSLVLLIGASLLVRTLQNIQHSPTGVDREHLVVIDVDAQMRGYSGERLLAFTREVTERLSRVGGVVATTWSENGIFSGTESGQSLQVPGFVVKTQDDTSANYDQVGPGYVKAIGAHLERGREFTEEDIAGRAPVAMINGTMARFYFGNTDPLGRSLKLDDTTTVQVVGVVGDIRDHELKGDVPRRFYVPGVVSIYGDPGALSFVVRTSSSAAALVPVLRKAIATLDPLLFIEDAWTLDFLMQQSVREERLLARLSAGFGALALLLASVGLYGVMQYSVSRRVGEIGLRVALGAQRTAVVRMVLTDALQLVAIGVVVGIPLGLGAAQLLQAQLYGVATADFASIAVALIVLSVAATLAALVPALRASRVAPLVAIQQE